MKLGRLFPVENKGIKVPRIATKWSVNCINEQSQWQNACTKTAQWKLKGLSGIISRRINFSFISWAAEANEGYSVQLSRVASHWKREDQ